MATRHDFYQTDGAVIISIYKKKADPQEVTVQFAPTTLKVAVAEEVVLQLDSLFARVEPSKSSYKTLGTKIEVSLAKASAGNWTSLSGSAQPIASSSSAVVPATAAPAAAESNNAPVPSEPSNGAAPTNKQKKDWSKIAANDDEEEEANGADFFFKKLYKDADDNTRRAMMKSYQESGGTTLSTNWQDVGSRTVTGEPPAGMERKKW